MQEIQSTLFHKILPPRQSHGIYNPALVMLHGRGANEDDLLGLTEYLDDRFFVISPRAPFPFEWGGGFTWYDILEMGRPEPRMFTESYSKLSEFLDDVVKGYPVDKQRLYLLGFSMGTMMSYAMLLTRPEAIAGVVANSGYVPEETELTFHWDRMKGRDIFIAHGIHDPVIPVTGGRRAKELFSKAQADVVYREYPMAHQISEESLNDLSRWLTERIDGHVSPIRYSEPE
jgi:phospholipase/carboxylesterase